MEGRSRRRFPYGRTYGASPRQAIVWPSRLMPTLISASSILRPMAEDYTADEISDIEARIEALAEVGERCRKIILVSKAAIAGGAGLLLVAILGLFGAGVSTALGSIALMLGGIVSLGSNVSTLRQTEAAIGAAEALRSELISGIDLRVVRDAPVKLM